MLKKPLRILHCPHNIGSNAQGLAKAERALGLQSVSVSFRGNIFNEPSDIVLLKGESSFLYSEFKRFGLFWKALREFDIIHYNFGSPIFPLRSRPDSSPEARYRSWLRNMYSRITFMRDLPLLKKAGKGIVVTYQGSDARQEDYSLEHFEISIANDAEHGYDSLAKDIGKRLSIAIMDRYVDRIYAVNPDLLHVLPSRSRFIPYASVDPQDWKPSQARTQNNVPLVLHAPSRRGTKGTKHILFAVEKLRKEGIRFEFQLVEDIPRSQVRALYQKADLVVDQLLAGWYGGLAVEVMALAKPVICYIREQDLKFVPPQMALDLPIIRATPGMFQDVLRGWLNRPRDELVRVGQDGRNYVQRWHDPSRIAASLKEDYQQIYAQFH